MQVRAWPSLVVIATFCCFALISGLYGFFAPDQMSLVVFVAVTALVGGLISAVVFERARGRQILDSVWSLKRDARTREEKNRKHFVSLEDFNAALASLEQQIQESIGVQNIGVQSQAEPMTPPVMAASYQQFPQNYQYMAANQPEPREVSSDLMAMAPGSEQWPEAEELLQFMLEPVIDLSSRKTAHYRAQVVMTDVDGREIDYATLVKNADQNSLRTSLDVHFVTQALPILRRLRLRHPAMQMFIPIGVDSLRSATTIEHITQLLLQSPDVASGVVFEIDHACLSELGEEGISGLASLARAGATMGLMRASVAGLDLVALAQLNVQYIGVKAASVDMSRGFAPAWREFVETARGLRLQIMLTDVYQSQQATSASQIARFVAGPFFAPPRRVRAASPEAAVAPLQSAAA